MDRNPRYTEDFDTSYIAKQFRKIHPLIEQLENGRRDILDSTQKLNRWGVHGEHERVVTNKGGIYDWVEFNLAYLRRLSKEGIRREEDAEEVAKLGTEVPNKMIKASAAGLRDSITSIKMEVQRDGFEVPQASKKARDGNRGASSSSARNDWASHAEYDRTKGGYYAPR